MNRENIKNIHWDYNEKSIVFEYGGQRHHYSLETLKDFFILAWSCFELQEEKKDLIKFLEDKIEYLKKIINKGNPKPYGEELHLLENSLLRYQEILDKIKEGNYE